MKKANLESLGHTKFCICFTSSNNYSEEWRTVFRTVTRTCKTTSNSKQFWNPSENPFLYSIKTHKKTHFLSFFWGIVRSGDVLNFEDCSACNKKDP